MESYIIISSEILMMLHYWGSSPLPPTLRGAISCQAASYLIGRVAACSLSVSLFTNRTYVCTPKMMLRQQNLESSCGYV